MATVRSRDYDSAYVELDEDKALGWVGFSAILIGFAGGWNILEGILALANSKVYTVTGKSYVFSDLHTWGWIVVLLGAAEVLAAFALLSGNQFARWFGIAAAGINGIGQLMYVPAQPFWALCMFALDVIVVYGLCVYGGRDAAPS